MVAYRDCKGHLVCMADAQTGIVEIQHKDRAVRMTVPVGDSFNAVFPRKLDLPRELLSDLPFPVSDFCRKYFRERKT